MANILAVDDNLELCKLIRTTLERDGHRVETRQAGRDLTEALCRWADCILLDVMMPGEDGFAVCRRIRSLTEAPILFLSARTDEAAVLEGLGIGADDFYPSPSGWQSCGRGWRHICGGKAVPRRTGWCAAAWPLT